MGMTVGRPLDRGIEYNIKHLQPKTITWGWRADILGTKKSI